MLRMLQLVQAPRHRRWLLALAFALVLPAVITARPTSAAGPPLTASGTFTQLSFTPSNSRTTGSVTHFDFTEQDQLTGTFTGSTVLQGSCVQRASGQVVCQAIETFTGTVAGPAGPVQGTVQFRDVAFLDLTTGAVHGSFTIVSGTGGLANLHGHGTFQGTGTTGTYTGKIVFAP